MSDASGAVSEADKLEEPTEEATNEEKLPPRQSRRSQKKQRRKEQRERLSKWHFLQKHRPDDAIKLIFSGDAIGPESGDGAAIGMMIVRAAHLLTSLGAKPQLANLAFGKSVTVEFCAPQDEVMRAEDKLEAAKALANAYGREPLPEQAEEIRLTLGEAVTDMVVASELAADLLSATSTEAPEAAVSLGSDVAESYRTLANAVSKAGLTFTIRPPASDPRELTPAKALRVAEQLREASEPREATIVSFGILSIANQEQHGFGLKLDPNARRPALLKGKRVVHGTYLPSVEARIRDEGLWGREVRATLQVVRDALVSTSTIRPASYTLIDVEPRHSD